MELNFTKEHTRIAKAIAIILMFIHHLFAFPERITQGQYISIFPYVFNNGSTLEFKLAVFGKICVAMYLFLSGYGIATLNNRNLNFGFIDVLKRIKKLYINYWVIFIIFVPIGFLFFQKKFIMTEFIKNFIGIINSYNGEWWFFKIYVILVLISPITKKIISKNLVGSFIRIGIFYSISILNIVIFKLFPDLSYISNTYIYSLVMAVLFNQASFFIGYLAFEFDLFRLIKLKFIDYKIDKKIVYIFLCVFIIYIRNLKYSTILDFLLAPIFIFSITNLFYKTKLSNILNYLSKHSTNMWLTHSFFCYKYLQKYIFYPKNSILVLITLVIVTVLSSEIIELILNAINNIRLKNKVNLTS
ncbi:MAG: acyltransferase family protein [Fusobacteriaceae bacterium]